MYTYPLRALSVTGDETVEFTLSDVPVKISEDKFVLRQRPRTPILQVKSITRGTDVPGLFEGDVVEAEDGLKYVITYKRGFVGIRLDKTWKHLRDLGSYRVIGSFYTMKEYDKINSFRRLQFKNGDTVFNPWQIVTASGDILLLNIAKGTKVRLSETRQYAGCNIKDKKLYFGDKVNGNQLTLNNGACGVFQGDTWVDFVDIVALID